MDYTDVLDECVKLFGDEKDVSLDKFEFCHDDKTWKNFENRLLEGIEQQPKDAKSPFGANEVFHQERVLKNVRYIVFISIRSFEEESLEKQSIEGTVALYVCKGYYIACVSAHNNDLIKKREEEWEKRRSKEKEYVLLDYSNE